MCGIAGVFGKSDEQAIRAAVQAQAKRGPDDAGLWSDPSVPATLGHCRLAVLDLSPAGHQPMSCADGRYRIVHNGEVYNFRELRRELEPLGFAFRTECDTEVILAAFAAWGPACVRRFRGMFAFALLDCRPPQGGPLLYLVRDRLGIKPLVYSRKGAAVWFASELRGLIAADAAGRSVDGGAVLDYLSAGSVVQPRTILQDARMLPPGHWMEIRRDHDRLVRYWDLHEATASLRPELRDITDSEAEERLRSLLEEATRYHLITDVPLGAFLSGGVDSTAVVGLMGQVAGQPVSTFSLGFESRHGDRDERLYARLAAGQLGARYREVVVPDGDAAAIFDQVLSAMDQPSSDGFNTWIISRAARREVTVAFSGLGGDELFAGYYHFGVFGLPRSNNGSVKTAALRLLRKAALLNGFTHRQAFLGKEPADRCAFFRQILRDEEMRVAFRPEFAAALGEHMQATHRPWLLDDADPVQQVSYVELHNYLVSTLLRDGDGMSMAHGLELRPVLLDHPLVEFAYALPARVKLDGRQSKKVFKAAVKEFLPEPIRTRRKMGFALPYAEWISATLRSEVTFALETRNARELFTPRYLRRLKVRLRQGQADDALWTWSVLLLWLERNGYSIG